MKKQTLIRDLSLLFIGCLVLFGVVTVVSMFGGEANGQTQSEFSSARRMAELSAKKRNWPNAVAGNQKLLELDPHNGHALYFLATSKYQVAMKSQKALKNAKDQGLSSNEIEQLEATFLVDTKSTMESFRKCIDFARYRNRARAYLALLHMIQGENDEAIELLDEAVDDGYYNQQNRLVAFNQLSSHPRFSDIAQKERANRERTFGRIRPQVFGK